ncbi:MAG: KEOPS complex subunit Pcc1 [Candidatus Nanohaloarchaea archaeon]
MKARLEIDHDNPDRLARSLSPSIQSDDRVRQEISPCTDSVEINIETNSIGTLRSATDSSIKLAMLSKKILR